MRLVALDSGTTSTRAWLMEDGRLLGGVHDHVGARDVAQGRSREWLAGQLAGLVLQVLEQHDLTPSHIEAVVGFGMVTSELGIEEVGHLTAPVDASQLARALGRDTGRTLGTPRVDGSTVPFYLVPGVRCGGEPAGGHRDFMRGEETEVVGLLASDQPMLPLLYVSPGSHSKWITVDTHGRITDSMTTLTGELAWALHKETILAEFIDPAREDIDLAYVLEGAEAARRDGLSRALFLPRLRSRLDGLDAGRCSDIALGALAGSDIVSLTTTAIPPPTVVVHGATGLARSYEALLRREEWVGQLRTVETPLGPLGAWDLFRRTVEVADIRVTTPQG